MLQNTPEQFQIPKHVGNTCKWLEYIWWSFNKTGRICLSYLRMMWSSVCEKLQQISELNQSCWYFNSFTLLICTAYQEGKVFCRYLEKMFRSKFCTSKYSRSRMGPKREHIWWIKKPFPKDIEEILINNKYKENEVNDEEDESDNEGNTF